MSAQRELLAFGKILTRPGFIPGKNLLKAKMVGGVTAFNMNYAYAIA